MNRNPASLLLFIVLFGTNASSAQDGQFDWGQSDTLYPGIQFTRVEVTEPRKLVICVSRVDTQSERLTFHTTPRRDDWKVGEVETDRQKTRDFLIESRQNDIPTVLAINADAFSPWPAPYNKSTPADLLGLAVSDGNLVSKGSGTPSIIQTRKGDWKIQKTSPSFDTSAVQLAISGFGICLDEGEAVPSGNDLHPRTGIGLSKDARYLFLIVIDGRQPSSFGVTTQELGNWLRHFGANRGINLDGGGSTTMACWDAQATPPRCRLLNRPVGNGARSEKLAPILFLSTERANGNNFGVALKPNASSLDQ